MAIWKSQGSLLMGRGVCRSKCERRYPRNMVKMEERLNLALEGAGYPVLHYQGNICVGMASAAKMAAIINFRRIK